MYKYKRKDEQLAMPFGTAANRLKKLILFNLLKKVKDNFCYQCGKEINVAEDLSIEHKIPFLNSEDPIKLFFDLDNIAFSHLKCNSIARRPKLNKKHPSCNAYKLGCRCRGCKDINKVRARKLRANRKNISNNS